LLEVFIPSNLNIARDTNLEVALQIPYWGILELARLIFIFVTVYTMSYLVREGKLKVNYSRKVAHFSHILSTLFINRTFLGYSIQYFVISGTLSLFQILLFSKPIRSRIALLDFFFLCYDRPEDRPHTVRLAFTQLLAMNSVLVGMALLYQYSGLSLDLLSIPMFVTAFGDGLAEPVGVRFGRNKYEVMGLFTDRVYTRSFEGSAMVALSTIIAFFVFRYLFSSGQLLMLIMFMPFLMTVTEAWAPHTWDNPFLYLVASSVIYFVMMFS
jgi:phytol kinase